MFKRGFTLIETLVAITILLIGVLGPLSVATRGIIDGMFARNQLVANYLAQEALDLVTNIRDSQRDEDTYNSCGIKDNTNCLVLRNIFSGIDCNFCTIDIDDNGSIHITSYPDGNSVPRIVFDDTEDRFKYLDDPIDPATDPTGPIYRRWITIETGNYQWGNLVKVTANLKWQNLANDRELAVSTYLYQCENSDSFCSNAL